MEILDLSTAGALVAALVLTFVWIAWRSRMAAARGSRRHGRRAAGGRARSDALDTVASWPPELARVMTTREREAYELIRRALPGFTVLAQVPLARFVRVPPRHDIGEWMQRVGQLSADLLICDGASRVLAVVDIRSTAETERARRRHERLGRVLRAAGVRVHVWQDAALPSVAEVRGELGASLAARTGAGQPGTDDARGASSGPVPLIPVAEIEELLAEGDAQDHSMEPVPSGFFDELEPLPAR